MQAEHMFHAGCYFYTYTVQEQRSDTMLRIGIYPRKSVYRDNSDSVQVQITACKDYARLMFKDQELDFRIYDKDEGFSGKNTNRPSFTEQANWILSSSTSWIVSAEASRTSQRSTRHCSSTTSLSCR